MRYAGNIVAWMTLTVCALGAYEHALRSRWSNVRNIKIFTNIRWNQNRAGRSKVRSQNPFTRATFFPISNSSRHKWNNMSFIIFFIFLAYEFFNKFWYSNFHYNKFLYFVFWSLAKMHIHKIISIFERSPIGIFRLARLLAARSGCLFRRCHLLLQRHKSVPLRWLIHAMVDARCINVVCIFLSLNHFDVSVFQMYLIPESPD